MRKYDSENDKGVANDAHSRNYTQHERDDDPLSVIFKDKAFHLGGVSFSASHLLSIPVHYLKILLCQLNYQQLTFFFSCSVLWKNLNDSSVLLKFHEETEAKMDLTQYFYPSEAKNATATLLKCLQGITRMVTLSA